MADNWNIRDQGSGRLVRNKEGYSQPRRWKISARSEIEAETAMRRLRNVFIDAPYYTSYGEKPDTSSVCRSISIEGLPHAPFGGRGDYLVEAEYGPAEKDEAVIGGPPVYRIKSSAASTPIDLDADGDPITNIVGEPIDPPLSDYSDQEVLSVEWWGLWDNLAAAFAEVRPYRNSLNLIEWQALAKGSARIMELSNSEEVEVEVDAVTKLWVKWSASIEVRLPIDTADLAATVIDKDGNTLTGELEGWVALYANRGRRELGEVVAGVQQYLPILTEDGGDVVSEPVPLGADGLRLPSASAQVVMARDVVRRYRDFNLLGI